MMMITMIMIMMNVGDGDVDDDVKDVIHDIRCK
jgi:hypothetical protein